MTSATLSKNQKQGKWLLRLGIFILALLMLLLLLFLMTPPLTKYVIVRALEQQGMTDVQIEALKWKPWIPSASIANVSWTTPAQEPVKITNASIAAQWQGVLDRQITINHIDISAVELPVSVSSKIKIAGIPIATGEPQQEKAAPQEKQGRPWAISLNTFTLQDSQFHVKGLPITDTLLSKSNYDINIDQLKIEDFSTLTPDKNTIISLQAMVDALAFRVDGKAAVLADAQTFDGTIKLLPSDPFTYANKWLNQELLQGIKGQGALGFTVDIDHQIRSQGRQVKFDLALNTPTLKTTLSRGLSQPLDIGIQKLQLNSQIALLLDQPEFTLSMDSSLLIDKAVATTAQGVSSEINNIDIKVKLAETQGHLSALNQIALDVDGQIALGFTKLENKEFGQVIAFNNLQTKSKLRGKTIEIPSFELQELHLLDATKPLTQRITLSDLRFGRDELGERAVTIADVLIEDLTAAVAIEQDSQIKVVRQLEQVAQTLQGLVTHPLDESKIDTTATPEQKPSPKKSNTKSLEWHIDNFALKGNNQVYFTDQRPGYDFEQTIDIKKLQLENLSMTSATNMTFIAQVGDGEIKSNGTITLADIQANTQLEASIQNLALPPLSPYIAPVIGYTAETGMIDALLTLDTKAGKGSGQLELDIHSMNLNAKDETLIADLSIGLPMPLEMTLSLLKNKNDTIELTIPIEFQKEGISSQIAPIIRQAVLRATKNASLSYLKYALQPYGSILMLAEQSGKMMNEMQLVNIEFDKMSATLGQEQQAPAEKIANLLENKESIKIKLCPTATKQEAQDWPIESDLDTAAALHTLALERAQSVKQYMKEKGVNTKRLFVCAPKIEDSGAGQVKVSL